MNTCATCRFQWSAENVGSCKKPDRSIESTEPRWYVNGEVPTEPGWYVVRLLRKGPLRERAIAPIGVYDPEWQERLGRHDWYGPIPPKPERSDKAIPILKGR